MNKVIAIVSFLASCIVIYKFLVEAYPSIKKKLKKYFPTTEQIEYCLTEYRDESNLSNKQMDYYLDFVKLFKDVLINGHYYLHFQSQEYGEFTNYLFDDFPIGHSTIMGGLSIVNRGDYLEITTLANCFKKRLCRKASIKYLNKILKENIK